MIPTEIHCQIRRLFYVEHLTIGAIGDFLGIHHSTVRTAIESDRFNPVSAKLRKSLLDPCFSFLQETLKKYPKITATRLQQMLTQRGYKGSVITLRERLREIRPRPKKAYLALTFLPGEQAQVDWASFGKFTVGTATRRLSCFVMVLSYSRYLFVRFTFDETLESFLQCHVEAFKFFGGVPRRMVYDNLKAAVVERMDTNIRFNTSLLAMADHYRFEPIACNVRSGHEKGRVERSIRYIRDSFFTARTFTDLNDANVQIEEWRDKVAVERSCPQFLHEKVKEVFAREQSSLMTLPNRDYLVQHTRTVRSGKTPYITYDCNYYSIPHRFVGVPLTLVSTNSVVRIIADQNEIAAHQRSYDRHCKIEKKEHFADLLSTRPKGQTNHGMARLLALSPVCEDLIEQLSLAGHALGGNISKLLTLLDQNGNEDFIRAVTEAVERKTPQARSVAFLLNRNAKERTALPIIPISLPNDDRVLKQIVPQTKWDQYQRLSSFGVAVPEKPEVL